MRAEDQGGEARHHDDHRHKKLQVGRKGDAGLGLVQALGRQRALDDVLVEAPVAEVHDPHPADQDGEARKLLEVRAVRPEDHVELLRELSSQGVEPREDIGRIHRPAADLAQGDGDDGQAARDQQADLHDVGQGHGLQPAPDLIGQRKHGDDHEGGELVDPRHRVHGDGAKPQDRGHIDEDVEAQPEHGHDAAHRRSVPLLQKLRHGRDIVAQEDGQEELGDDQEGEGGHPLIGGDGEADGVSRARHADDLLGGDVGGDQRGADGPPGQGPARQEVVGAGGLGVVAAHRHPLRQTEHGDRVDREHHKIHCRQGPLPRKPFRRESLRPRLWVEVT